MIKRGSASIETLEAAGYELNRYTGDGSAVLYNTDTQNMEVFAIRETPISGWQIEHDGKYFEFCHEVN